jgi:LacI family transcriptional regulator
MARPSVKEVAARAGVSVGTVSNALNRPDLVKPATRERVERAMAELGFVRNESARQLRAGHSRLVAFVVPDVANPFFTDVARAAEAVATEAGLALILCDSDARREREDRYLELLLEQRVHGVLITAVDYDNPRLRTLPERGVPVVLVDRVRQPGDTACSVGVDDVEGGRLAVVHLLEQGHSRIAFVGQPGTMVQVTDRHAGALAAVLAAGGREEDLVVLDAPRMDVAHGRAAGQRLLGIPAARRPTAAFCANDLLALGLLQAMTRHGQAVPEDLAIVGYDDIEFAAAAAVPLTSVRQPRKELGRRAVEFLLEEASTHDGEPPHVVFRPELVVRASSIRSR